MMKINLRCATLMLVVFFVAIACLVLDFPSFHQIYINTTCTETSKNITTGADGSVDMMSLIHGNVERLLRDGRLPLDPGNNTSWSLWGSDPSGSPCSEYKTRFGEHLPRVWLASYPGSGNTWTRYLLEAASGVFTGSIYKDKSLLKKGFLGEHDRLTSKRTLVQKMHCFSTYTDKSKGCRHVAQDNGTVPTILLLRNPAKAILSLYKYVNANSHTKQLPASTFKKKKFHTFVSGEMRRWLEMALDHLLGTTAPLHVVHYERLVQEPIQELTALLAFLGVPLDDGRMKCIASHLDGSFKRAGSPVLDPYTAVEKAVMAAETAAVNMTLQLMGYAPLPTY